MMKKKKRLLLIPLCLVVLVSVFPLAWAYDGPQKASQKILLSSQTVAVDGVNVRFDLYNDNGFLVQTATPLYGDMKQAVSDPPSASAGRPIDADALIRASDALMETDSTARTGKITPFFYPNPYHMSNSAVSPANSYCYAGHWADWSAIYNTIPIVTPFIINSDNMYVRGLYSGPELPYQTFLSQLLDWSSIGVQPSFSVPLGFSVSLGVNGGSASTGYMGPYSGFMVTASTGNASVSSPTAILNFGMTSSSNIFPTPSNSFITTVHNDCKIYDWLYPEPSNP